MDGAETRRTLELISVWRHYTMKKFLLATVALVALGATVPALAADLGAAPLTYNKAPAYVRRSITGPASISAVTSAARSRATIAWCSGRQQRPFSGRRAGRRGLPVRARTGWSASKASTAGSSNNNGGAMFPGGFLSPPTAELGSVTGRLGYSWGPALLYVKGGYAYKRHDDVMSASDGRVRHHGQPPRWLHRRRRSRIHVRPELVGQG